MLFQSRAFDHCDVTHKNQPFMSVEPLSSNSVMPLWETFDALVPIPGPMATLRNSLTFWEHRKSLGERVGLREEDFQL